eukprot:SAG22_NODE_1771_length_3616_cov_7.362834_2_plen_727_part_01
MARAVPYRARAPPGVAAQLAEVPYSRLFVIHEPGPTSFVLRGEESSRKYRVSVGEQHSCNCGTPNELCEHVLFVLVRVFRMQIANPLVWQLGLTEREITELLRGRPAAMLTRPPPRQSAAQAAAVPEEGVPRKEMDDDELCPICYDTMSLEQDVTFCKRSCGKNVHTKCMKMWADNRISNGDGVTCPMCRSDWGVPDWLGRPRNERRHNALPVHTGVTCAGCRVANFAGARYKCMICNNYDLCARCFEGGDSHNHHPFICREGIDTPWVPADRTSSSPRGSGGGGDGGGAETAAGGSPDEADENLGMASGGPAPLAVSLVTKLPVRTASGADGGEPGQCELCSSGYRPLAVLRYLPCGCSFHQRCVDRHLTEHTACCPASGCGEPVTAEAVDRQLAAIAAERRRQAHAASGSRGGARRTGGAGGRGRGSAGRSQGGGAGGAIDFGLQATGFLAGGGMRLEGQSTTGGQSAASGGRPPSNRAQPRSRPEEGRAAAAAAADLALSGTAQGLPDLGGFLLRPLAEAVDAGVGVGAAAAAAVENLRVAAAAVEELQAEADAEAAGAEAVPAEAPASVDELRRRRLARFESSSGGGGDGGGVPGEDAPGSDQIFASSGGESMPAPAPAVSQGSFGRIGSGQASPRVRRQSAPIDTTAAGRRLRQPARRQQTGRPNGGLATTTPAAAVNQGDGGGSPTELVVASGSGAAGPRSMSAGSPRPAAIGGRRAGRPR